MGKFDKFAKLPAVGSLKPTHCDNSPCKGPRQLRGEAAGIAFEICVPCSDNPRFRAIEFERVRAK